MHQNLKKCNALREHKNQKSKSIRKIKLHNNRLKDKLTQRNECTSMLPDENKELSFQLEVTLTEAEQNVTKIELERDDKNRKAWPSLFAKIMIKMLVNGTPPSAASKNLESTMRLMCPNANVKELPNVDCIRNMRGIIRIITEMLAAYELSNNEQWKQLCTDGTSRRTTNMSAFGASMMNNDVVRLTLLACSHVGLCEKARMLLIALEE